METLSPKLRSTRNQAKQAPQSFKEGDEPLSDEERRGAVSKAALESREAAPEPIIMQPRGVDLDEEDLVSQITIWRNTPCTIYN